MDDLVFVLDSLRSGAATTRPQLERHCSLGRSVIAQRVKELIDAGLVREGRLGPSTGGRAPRQLQFAADAGVLLLAECGATGFSAAVTDVGGGTLAHHDEQILMTVGPNIVMARIEEVLDSLLARLGDRPADVWGIGIGLPGPVEFSTGRPVSPSMMPGWDAYDVRGRLSNRYNAPVWVDNEVNLMALGALRRSPERANADSGAVRDLMYVKVGTSVGAGFVSGGRLHRGAQGCAGDIGHIMVVGGDEIVCRCGNTGCLAAVAGGSALARDAAEAARSGLSTFLRDRAQQGEPLTARDVADGVGHGDTACRDLLMSAGAHVGQVLAQIVNMFNPSLILIGGGVSESGDAFLAAIRQAVYHRSLPLATRDLRIALSPDSHQMGLAGAAAMVLDELFLADRFELWLPLQTPHGHPELVDGYIAGSADGLVGSQLVDFASPALTHRLSASSPGAPSAP